MLCPYQLLRKAKATSVATKRFMVRTGPPPESPPIQAQGYVSYSLNSSKGGYIGDNIGDYYKGY